MTTQYSFDGFRLDPEDARLWRGNEVVALKPKPFAVLQYLLEHAGKLASKESLLQTIWPDTVVADDVLKVCIHDIRKALGDSPRQPRYLATEHRRGYRFIAEVLASEPMEKESRCPSLALAAESDSLAVPENRPRRPPLVGREEQLQRLHSHLEAGLRGQRQMVFVTGDAGMGKTALVETFAAGLTKENGPNDSEISVAWGQCLEHLGPSEAFLPLLEAFSRLGQGEHGRAVREILYRQAPTWLVQMPSLFDEPSRGELEYELNRATRPRMLRELADALEAITQITPVVLIVEDLHWSDRATLDQVRLLAHRRGPARLLILLTVRPLEASLDDRHVDSLQEDLLIHGLAEKLPLPLLDRAAVEDYVARRFEDGARLEALHQHLLERTEGHPLFLKSLVDQLLETGTAAREAPFEKEALETPRSLLMMLNRQLERLSPAALEILEGASVSGFEFSATSVAAALDRTPDGVADLLESLVRRQQFLRQGPERSQLDRAPRFRFSHALYRQAALERIPGSRRRSMHLRIARHLEDQCDTQSAELPAKLALHFEAGGDVDRAIKYRELAAHYAVNRHAQAEAADHLEAALQHLQQQPENRRRDEHELNLRTALGAALMSVRGYASTEVESSYVRALELGRKLGASKDLFPALRGLAAYHYVRAEYEAARELAVECLTIAESAGDEGLLLEAHSALGSLTFFLGELVDCRDHCQRGVALYDRDRHSKHAFRFGQEPGSGCHSYLALALWLLGYPDEAAGHSETAVALARNIGHPLSLARALTWEAMLDQFQRRPSAVIQTTKEVSRLSDRDGFPIYGSMATILGGWARSEQGEPGEGLRLMEAGDQSLRQLGVQGLGPYILALQAEALLALGEPGTALTRLDRAMQWGAETEEHFYQAELHRLEAEALLQRSITHDDEPVKRAQRDAAAVSLSTALELARARGMRGLALRAASSQARMWREERRAPEARRLLQEHLAEFDSSAEGADLVDARALLAKL